MSLGSPGKLGDSRPLGGTRGLLRREIRRNKDNPQIANKYREQLSDMNIARGMRGDSLIGSSESDAKEVVARRNMQMQQLGQGAGVATGSYAPATGDQLRQRQEIDSGIQGFAQKGQLTGERLSDARRSAAGAGVSNDQFNAYLSKNNITATSPEVAANLGRINMSPKQPDYKTPMAPAGNEVPSGGMGGTTGAAATPSVTTGATVSSDEVAVGVPATPARPSEDVAVGDEEVEVSPVRQKLNRNADAIKEMGEFMQQYRDSNVGRKPLETLDPEEYRRQIFAKPEEEEDTGPPSLIGGIPAAQSIARSRQRVANRQALSRGEIPDLNAQDGETGYADDVAKALRGQFYQDFEEKYGREAMLDELLERREARNDARDEQRRLAIAREDQALGFDGDTEDYELPGGSDIRKASIRSRNERLEKEARIKDYVTKSMRRLGPMGDISEARLPARVNQNDPL